MKSPFTRIACVCIAMLISYRLGGFLMEDKISRKEHYCVYCTHKIEESSACVHMPDGSELHANCYIRCISHEKKI